ncbi:HAD family hydrolase [Deinococcus peraridilitoris]|uniref:Haloacid dehalogenase superfamily protein, subfamily IA, variant 3 with third motif having DD or ED n=1 Tax=Deinococcus peraridilitoris (strain DSM 19664 / LMG 22246 / CIP 109416 / KR-200) TaxID=937777 RepID=L0A0B6_DEIPD|nr:HAD-IA family hydrolase [Deinococcus peraridilitoris]AFZ67286.1 haloacid dehalogenase superfamily protein, subfamily IA, variant 3 with third motif having DD or ED [Deinococcus peraridilitoris DSM 19664]
MSASPKALLFDIDGTLTATDPLHFQAWAQSLRKHGLNIDEAIYQQRISGRLNPDIVADLLPALGADETEAFIAQKEETFRALATSIMALPGLSELLHWARQHDLPCAVVSNAPRDNAVFVLSTLGLDRTFAHIVLADDLPRGKPFPDPYLEALRRLGVNARDTFAFEDSPSGVRSAVAAGIPTVGLTTGHGEEALQEAGAALIVPNFADPRLPQFLGVPAFAISG